MGFQKNNIKKIYVIDDLFYKINHAGYKARIDTMRILTSGLSNSIVYEYYKQKLLPVKNRVLRVLKRKYKEVYNYFNFLVFLKKRVETDLLIVTYPIETNYNIAKKIYSDLREYKEKLGFRLIFIVIDIDSIRRDHQTNLFEEAERLGIADKVITHNSRMSALLAEKGLAKDHLGELEIFDYLYDSEFNIAEINSEIKGYNIVFAGNLEKGKSGFLYKWTPKVKVDLLGINLDDSIDKGIFDYLGEFESSTAVLNDRVNSLGLVWDGPSVETCEGNVGEYLKYSNPHKASLYLSQGIPVFVWKHSAVSDFVSKNNVGILIEKLEDINVVLSTLKEEDFLDMRNNAIFISRKMRNGEYLKSAIFSSIKEIDHIKKE